MKTTDVFAATNPALGSLVLHTFVKAFTDQSGHGMEHPLAFLPLTFALSEQYSQTFVGTNSRTGLFAWIDRNPTLQIGLADSIEAVAPFSREALCFGLRYGLLDITQESRLIPTSSFLLTSAKRKKLNTEVLSILSTAKQLGNWVANVDSTRQVFY